MSVQHHHDHHHHHPIIIEDGMIISTNEQSASHRKAAHPIIYFARAESLPFLYKSEKAAARDAPECVAVASSPGK